MSWKDQVAQYSTNKLKYWTAESKNLFNVANNINKGLFSNYKIMNECQQIGIWEGANLTTIYKGLKVASSCV